MSFEARQSIIGKLLNDSIYRIPRNQRSYVWSERNWEDLYQDISLIVKGVAQSHFIGSIVLMKEEEEDGLGVFTVIDGQQRVITITILLAAITFSLKKRDLSEDAAGTRKYLLATDIKNVEHVIVSPEKHLSLERIVERVVNVVSSDIGQKTANAFAGLCCVSRQKDKSILDAFRFFCAKLSSLDNEGLISFRNALISTSYVNIASSSEEDSYTIFEILNARGMELEDHELLKNYIMRYINPIEKRDDAKAVWAEIESLLAGQMTPFLRHYAIQKYKFVKSGNEGPYKRIRDYTNPEKASELLYDLRKKADYYARITNPVGKGEEAEILLFFKSRSVKIFRPLFMSLMNCRDCESITEEEYEDSLRFLYRFYICFKVVGGLESSNLVESIAKYSNLLETRGCSETLEEWKQSFAAKFPSMASLKSSLGALGWSNKWSLFAGSKQKERCRLVIDLVEQIVGRVKSVEPFTIEHILPDSQNESNSMIGNLLPLEDHLNKRCKDLSLEEKLPIYSESRYASTRAFAARYSQEKFQIPKRSDKIADLLYKEFVKE